MQQDPSGMIDSFNIAFDEDGNVSNYRFSGGGGRIYWPSEEEQQNVGLALYRAGEKSKSDLGWATSDNNLAYQYLTAIQFGYDGYYVSISAPWLRALSGLPAGLIPNVQSGLIDFIVLYTCAYYEQFRPFSIEYKTSSGQTCLVLDPSKQETQDLIANGVKEIVDRKYHSDHFLASLIEH